MRIEEEYYFAPAIVVTLPDPRVASFRFVRPSPPATYVRFSSACLVDVSGNWCGRALLSAFSIGTVFAGLRRVIVAAILFAAVVAARAWLDFNEPCHRCPALPPTTVLLLPFSLLLLLAQIYPFLVGNALGPKRYT